MELTAVYVKGYKRFFEKSKLEVGGKLTAIVGPNEAGKSSLLSAMLSLNHQRPFEAAGASQELTREEPISSNSTIVEALFLLDASDREAVSSVEGAEVVRWMTIGKLAKGGRFWCKLEPAPQRDHSLRDRVVIDLRRYFEEIVNTPQKRSQSDNSANDKNLEQTAGAEDTDYEAERLHAFTACKQLLAELPRAPDDLPDELLSALSEAAKELENSASESDDEGIEGLSSLLLELREVEKSPSPESQAREILFARRPSFLFFDDAERLLESEYDLTEMVEGGVKTDDLPQALENLAELAALPLSELAAAVRDDDAGRIDTLLVRANATLRGYFTEYWSQSSITVRLRVGGQRLSVLVGNHESGFERLAERSDGLRQFVALCAFMQRRATHERYVILIDEIETHLHYNAQADLVQMLARQEVVDKIIYTTHSIGSLPEDLGTGVRLVKPSNEKNRSVVENWFWNQARAGFSPLLFGMGASTLAFIPVRFAVLAEGAADHILLPTLFREATGRDCVGFQVAPGLASADAEGIAVVDREAPRIVYLTDSDCEAGKLRRLLSRAGVPPDRVFQIGDGENDVVLEDLLDPAVYESAVNEELQRSHGLDVPTFSLQADVPNRPRQLQKWCSENGLEDSPGKRAVAYMVLTLRHERPLLHARSRAGLRSLHAAIMRTMNGGLVAGNSNPGE